MVRPLTTGKKMDAFLADKANIFFAPKSDDTLILGKSARRLLLRNMEIK